VKIGLYKNNYVILEAEGKGHYVGCFLFYLKDPLLRLIFWDLKMILKKNKKRESFINRIFITFMVLVSILFLFISIYFYMNYGDKEEELSILFIILFIASFIGGIVYTPVHLEFLKYKEYSLCTAISNYFLMLIESTIIFYGFSLNGFLLFSISFLVFIFSHILSLLKSHY
jgi:uncharacterized membrane protein YeiB